MKKILFGLVVFFTVVTAMHVAQAAPTTLSNGYIQVGVADAGTFINWDTFTGIKYDPTGNGNYGALDFITPGNPFQFYSVGASGAYTVAGGGSDYNPLNAKTFGYGQVAVTTSGIWDNLGMSQVAYLSPTNPSVIVVDVTLKNISSNALNNVVFAVGMDPDQDANINGNYATRNTITGNNLVSAYGDASKYKISLFSDSYLTHTPSISTYWETNPYSLLAGMNGGHGDNTIALAFNLGTLAKGQSTTVEYQMQVSKATPIPGAAWLLGSGLAGLIGLRRKFS